MREVEGAHGQVGPNITGATANATPNERRKRPLGELARDVRITLSDVEKRFAVTVRTVKRDLADMVKCGLIEFVRAPHPGYCRLTARG